MSELLHNQSCCCCFGGLLALVPLNAAEPSQLRVLKTDEMGEKAKGDESPRPTSVCHSCCRLPQSSETKRGGLLTSRVAWGNGKTKANPVAGQLQGSDLRI